MKRAVDFSCFSGFYLFFSLLLFSGIIFSSFAEAAEPVGYLDEAAQDNVSGWAYDADKGEGPINVHIYIDGTFRASVLADGYRPDVDAANPGYGKYHGFNWTPPPLSLGTHEVKAYGINYPSGPNVQLTNIKHITVAAPSPVPLKKKAFFFLRDVVDNTPKGARPIKPGAKPFMGKILPGDEDWYRFSTTSGQSYWIVLSAGDSPLMPQLQVYDFRVLKDLKIQPQFSSKRSYGREKVIMARIEAKAKEIYYVRVLDAEGKGGPNFKYKIAVALESPEPGNTPKDANLLSDRKALQVINPKGDRDWWKLGRLERGKWSIELQRANPDFRPKISVYTEEVLNFPGYDQPLIGSASISEAEESVSVDFDTLEPKLVYAKITDVNDRGGPNFFYRLTFKHVGSLPIPKITLTNLVVVPRDPKEYEEVSASAEVWNISDVPSLPCIVRIYAGGKQVGEDYEISEIEPRSFERVERSWIAQKGEIWQIVATLDRAEGVGPDDVDIASGEVTTEISVRELGKLKISSFVAGGVVADGELTAQEGKKIDLSVSLINTGGQVPGHHYNVKFKIDHLDYRTLPGVAVAAKSFAPKRFETSWRAREGEHILKAQLIDYSAGDSVISQEKKIIKVKGFTPPRLSISTEGILIEPSVPAARVPVKFSIKVRNDGTTGARKGSYWAVLEIDGVELCRDSGVEVPPGKQREILFSKDWIAQGGRHLIEAELVNPGRPVEIVTPRWTEKELKVEKVKNKALVIKEIEILPQEPVEGDDVILTLVIQNVGDAKATKDEKDVDSYKVRFFSEDGYECNLVREHPEVPPGSQVRIAAKEPWRPKEGSFKVTGEVSYKSYKLVYKGPEYTEPYQARSSKDTKTRSVIVKRPAPKLVFSSSDISLSPANPIEGEDITIAFSLHNTAKGYCSGGNWKISDKATNKVFSRGKLRRIPGLKDYKVTQVIAGADLSRGTHLLKIEIETTDDRLAQHLEAETQFEVFEKLPIDFVDAETLKAFGILAGARKNLYEHLSSVLTKIRVINTVRFTEEELEELNRIYKEALEELFEVDGRISGGIKLLIDLGERKRWGKIVEDFKDFLIEWVPAGDAFQALEISKEFREFCAKKVISVQVPSAIKSADEFFGIKLYQTYPEAGRSRSLSSLCYDTAWYNVSMCSLSNEEAEAWEKFADSRGAQDRTRVIEVIEEREKLAWAALENIEWYFDEVEDIKFATVSEEYTESPLKTQALNVLNRIKKTLKNDQKRAAAVLENLFEQSIIH